MNLNFQLSTYNFQLVYPHFLKSKTELQSKAEGIIKQQTFQ